MRRNFFPYSTYRSSQPAQRKAVYSRGLYPSQVPKDLSWVCTCAEVSGARTPWPECWFGGRLTKHHLRDIYIYSIINCLWASTKYTRLCEYEEKSFVVYTMNGSNWSKTCKQRGESIISCKQLTGQAILVTCWFEKPMRIKQYTTTHSIVVQSLLDPVAFFLRVQSWVARTTPGYHELTLGQRSNNASLTKCPRPTNVSVPPTGSLRILRSVCVQNEKKKI